MMGRGKSLEELEEMKMDLFGQDEAKDGYYSQLIFVYEQMYRYLNILKRDRPEDYTYPFTYVKKQLVACYIKYGTYMKMGLEKNPSLAESALKNTLQYDAKNPMAYYRLGFLAY